MDNIFFETFNILLYNFRPHCRSICRYMDPCQAISTGDTGDDIDRGNRMSKMNSFNFYSALAESMGTISTSERITYLYIVILQKYKSNVDY